jgi:hypothetical protein
VIYFMRRPDGGRIKIGTTIRLSKRLKELCDEVGDDLHVMAVLDGNRDVEKDLHRRFAELRADGEWFEPGDDLVGFIVAEGRAWDGSSEAPETSSVKLHIDVVESARIVVAYRGGTMTDMLSDILRPILAKMEREAVAKRSKGDQGAKGKGPAK